MVDDQKIYNVCLNYDEMTVVMEGIRCYLTEILERIEEDDYEPEFENEVKRAEGIMHLIMRAVEK